MRLRIYILIAFALPLFSCISDLSVDQAGGKGCIALTVYNTTMGTRAAATELDNGTERERLLTRLDVFLYPKGKTEEACVFHKNVSDLNNVSGTQVVPVYVSTDMEELLFPNGAAQCDVFVVANLPEDIVLTGKEKVSELKAISIVTEDFADVVASDGTFVAPEKFIMSGQSIATRDGDNISGTVPLKRAASKVTMTILIPEYLMVKATNTADQTVREEKWHPYFVDPADPTKGVNAMHMGYHKGLGKTVVEGVNERKLEDTFETLYTSEFTYMEIVTVTKENGESKNYYKFKCDVSFYSYAFSWVGQDNDLHAPYFTLMIPWKRDEDERFTTYYYQVMVNGLSKKVERNSWYDISLNIGVLGSRVYNEPTILEDMSCYVLDWSTGIEADVTLNEWRYLVIPETYIEMNNTNVGELPIEASHKVAWTLEWPGSLEGLDAVEKYNEKNKYSSYYINCRSNPPTSVQMTGVSNGSFSLSADGNTLILKNNIPDNVYSPIYYHLKVWLDLTPNGVLDNDEQSFVEWVTYVQYPPIYLIPDQSLKHSIFVNGINSTENGSADNNDIKYNNNLYNLGRIPGTSDSGDHMYVLNVSTFKSTDKFDLDNVQYDYLIGDPRVTEIDNQLNNDGYNMYSHWATAPSLDDQNHTSRQLMYYYPTAKEGDVFRVIAPKLRIVSFMSSGYSKITPEGAAMRCASFQEHGFPAGRWRLPTYAEIRFIISLQQKQVIQDIFYGGNYYYSSTHQVRNQSTIEVRKIDFASTSFVGSVRCVYDEWYWGSEREALTGTKYAGGYGFTWGDRPR